MKRRTQNITIVAGETMEPHDRTRPQARLDDSRCRAEQLTLEGISGKTTCSNRESHCEGGQIRSYWQTVIRWALLSRLKPDSE